MVSQENKTGVLLVLCLVAGLLLYSGYTVQQQSIIQHQTLSFVPENLSLDDLEPLGVALCNWQFKMRDKNTGQGIPDVHINIIIDIPIVGRGEYSCYTDQNGYAQITTIQYQWTKVVAKHPNYQTREDIFDSRGGSLYVDWQLTPDAGGEEGKVKIVLYTQVDKKRWRIIGGINVGDEHYGIGRNYPYKTVMFLMEDSTHMLTVEGYYYAENNVAKRKDFSYNIEVTTNNSDESYWIDVLTGDLHAGTPPYVPDDFNWWKALQQLGAWLQQYWLLVLVGAITLYSLPHIATIYATYKR